MSQELSAFGGLESAKLAPVCRAWAPAYDKTGTVRRKASFLNKRSKKLLLIGGGGTRVKSDMDKSFLVLFFKKEQLSS
jgi:hypothetical protein